MRCLTLGGVSLLPSFERIFEVRVRVRGRVYDDVYRGLGGVFVFYLNVLPNRGLGILKILHL